MLVKEIEIINESIIKHPIVPNGQGWVSSEPSRLGVIESGPSKILMNKIITLIESATDFICLQSFLIQDTPVIDALLKAVRERKIKVYVLSSSDARLKDVIEEEGDDFIRSNYIKMLETKFKNHFIFRSADNFHAKFILIDPKTSPKGFLCTSNFTLKAFTRNPELAVALSKEQCEELFKVFVYHFWEYTTDEYIGETSFEKVKPINKFNLSEQKDILLTSPNTSLNTLNKRLIVAVQRAEKEIQLSTFHLDQNHELLKQIILKAESGIKVTLFCRASESQYINQLKLLSDKGINIYLHPLMHAKSLLVDEVEGYLFTANLMAKGLDDGFEVGVKLGPDQIKDLKYIYLNWARTFKSRLIKEAKINSINEYSYYRNNSLEKQEVKEEAKEIRKKIIKVKELEDFFDQKLQLNNMTIKKQKIKLVADFNKLPTKIVFDDGVVFKVQVEKNEKGTEYKSVLLSNTFTTAHIKELPNIDAPVFIVQQH